MLKYLNLKKLQCKSFTLIEILVSITIFVLVVAAATGVFVSSIESKQRVYQLKEIEDNARYAMEMMTREIRMGSIDGSEADTAADDQLKFTNSNGDNIVYYLSGTELKKIVNSDPAEIITSSKVKVTNLIFYVSDFVNKDVQQKVTISMTVESAANSLVKMDFQSTISPRVAVSRTPPNLILFWDGTDVAGNPISSLPAGWSCISCGLGSDFHGRFLRGDSPANYGLTGGVAKHRHNFGSAGLTSSTASAIGGAGESYPYLSDIVHFNPITFGTCTDYASNLPKYRNLMIIKSDGPATSIPAGAIALFDGVPSVIDWTRYSEQDGYFIRGADFVDYGDGEIVGVMGGSDTHVHTYSAFTMMAPTLVATTRHGLIGGTQFADRSHTHDVPAGTTPPASNEPPYIKMILAKAKANIINTTMIGIFDDSPPNSWAALSESGGILHGNFFKASNTYNETPQGSEDHGHVVISGPAKENHDNLLSSGSTHYSLGSHTHKFYLTANNLFPPYKNVVFAKGDFSSGFVNQNIPLENNKFLAAKKEQEQGFVSYIKNISETFLKKLDSFFVKLNFYNNFVLFNNISQKIEKIFKNLI